MYVCMFVCLFVCLCVCTHISGMATHPPYYEHEYSMSSAKWIYFIPGAIEYKCANLLGYTTCVYIY